MLSLEIRHQAAGFEQLLHELRYGLELVFFSRRDVLDNALCEVHFELVALLHVLRDVLAFDERQSDIKAVPVEDPGIGFRDDT